MPPTQARRRPVGRTRRQPTTWSRLVMTDFFTVPAASKVLLANFTLGNPGIGETVRRTRGQFAIISDQSAAPEFQLGAIGGVVISDVAAAVGVTATPGPFTERDDDGWFFWQGFTESKTAAGGNQTLWSY